MHADFLRKARRSALCLAAALATVSPTHAAEDAAHWYRCNTHTHTASFPNSDANASGEFVAQWYKKHGYQCLIITDHEHLTPVDFLNKELGADGQFLLIQGQEITQGVSDSRLPGGVRWSHVNGIGTRHVIMPQGLPEELPHGMTLGEAYLKYAPQMTMADSYVRNTEAIYSDGGIAQINHPEAYTGPRLSDLMPIKRPFLLEVWNAFPSISPLGGVDDDGTIYPSFESLWDSLLTSGKTVWAVAADDAHDYFNFDDRMAPTPGKAWIVVRAPHLTQEAVLSSIRRGQFYASTGVTLKDYKADPSSISIVIDFPYAWRSSTEHERVTFKTQFIGKGGRVLAEMTGSSPHYTLKGDEGYVRASIIDSDGRRAWTQPQFTDGRAGTAQNPPPRPMQPIADPVIDPDGSVHVPALVIPFSTLASEELKQNFVLRRRPTLPSASPDDPTDPHAILEFRRVLAQQQAPVVTRLTARFSVDIKPLMISGVQTDVVTPSAGIPQSNENRVLINLHGGGMTVGARWGAQEEAIPIASLAQIKVVGIDYRMYPEARFPAASEDVAAVYRALLKQYPAENIGIYGCSAGADLTAQSVVWFQAHGLPRPGAIGLFSSGAGVPQGLSDSNYVGAALQGAGIPMGYPVSPTGKRGYLEGADLSSPLVSPVHHPDILRQFPPTLLLSGTRDFLLSSVIYTHSQLVEAAVDAELHVWEGADHCFFALGEYDPAVPETRQAWHVIAQFFDKHLGRKPAHGGRSLSRLGQPQHQN